MYYCALTVQDDAYREYQILIQHYAIFNILNSKENGRKTLKLIESNGTKNKTVPRWDNIMSNLDVHCKQYENSKYR